MPPIWTKKLKRSVENISDLKADFIQASITFPCYGINQIWVPLRSWCIPQMLDNCTKLRLYAYSLVTIPVINNVPAMLTQKAVENP
jgi:hypothetical protein